MSLFARRAGRKAFDKTDRATRAITFYAEDGDSWPHFEPIIRELTGPLGRDLCYLTSSKDDPVLALEDPHLHAFEIGEGFKRTYLFQTLEVGVLVATVPQLGIPLLPRSKRAKTLGTDYLYVFHSMASTHMIYEPDGFDHYDTVCCVGPYMVDEIRKREELHGLPPKQLVEHGYGRLDAILAAGAGAAPRPVSDPPVVLVAPSWGPHCLLETSGKPVVEALLDSGAEVILRPHPMTNRKSPDVVPALVKEFSSHPRFTHDADLVSQESLHRSDLMVSDWSGAALEYAFGLERPVLFVDVPRKVNNPDYPELGIEPFEATVREKIGKLVAPDALDRIPAMVDDLVANRAAFVDGIRTARDENVFNVGTSGQVAATVIADKADAYLARVGG